MGDVPALTHPQPRCQPASPSRLLWQMFGCAMATPEQDVPLDYSRDKPTLHRPPTVPLPKACCEEEPLGSGWGTNGDCVRQAGVKHPSMGSAVRRRKGEKEDTRVHSPAEALLWQLAWPSAQQRMLRKQRGKRSCREINRAGLQAADCLFPHLQWPPALTEGLCAGTSCLSTSSSK